MQNRTGFSGKEHVLAGPFIPPYLLNWMDRTFSKWWLSRVTPFRDVLPEKLAAEREAMERQQDYNRNYAEFLNGAVLPAIDELVKMLSDNTIVHRVTSW